MKRGVYEMDTMYAMQRANGDWFAFAERGRLRVPVFRSSWEGMLARTRNWGMLLFKPVAFDRNALDQLAPAEGEGGAYFWLVDSPSADVSRGRAFEHGEIALLVHDDAGKPHELGGAR